MWQPGLEGSLGKIRYMYTGFPGGAVVKNPPADAGDAGDAGSIFQGRSAGVGNGNPLQYSCLENSMDRGAWWATVHGVTKNRTCLSTHALITFIFMAESRCSPQHCTTL